MEEMAKQYTRLYEEYTATVNNLQELLDMLNNHPRREPSLSEARIDGQLKAYGDVQFLMYCDVEMGGDLATFVYYDVEGNIKRIEKMHNECAAKSHREIETRRTYRLILSRLRSFLSAFTY